MRSSNRASLKADRGKMLLDGFALAHGGQRFPEMTPERGIGGRDAINAILQHITGENGSTIRMGGEILGQADKLRGDFRIIIQQGDIVAKGGGDHHIAIGTQSPARSANVADEWKFATNRGGFGAIQFDAGRR